ATQTAIAERLTSTFVAPRVSPLIPPSFREITRAHPLAIAAAIASGTQAAHPTATASVRPTVEPATTRAAADGRPARAALLAGVGGIHLRSGRELARPRTAPATTADAKVA